MFAGDVDQVELMRALLADCTSVFLRLCSSTSLSTQSDLIQAFYNMHLKLTKKDMNMVVQAVGSNLSEIFKCGKCFYLILWSSVDTYCFYSYTLDYVQYL